MKHTLYILSLLTLLTSCNKFLDIVPDGQVKREEMLSTREGIEDALYGVYAQMRQGNLYGQVLTIGDMEVLAQNLDCYGNTRIAKLAQYDFESSDVEETFISVWENMYKNISAANSVLSAPLVSGATDFPYTLYRGEALALRAFMHFDLVRIFCLPYTHNSEAYNTDPANGIPYQNEFSLNTPPFESLKANYDHIIADLKQAESLLDAAEAGHSKNETLFLADRQMHLNLWGVKALLARVYLNMGNQTEALRYAQDVIDHSPYTLKSKTEVMNDVAGVLSKKECLFGIYYADYYSIVSNLLQKTVSFTSLDPRPDFKDIYGDNNGDMRLAAYFTTIEQGGAVKYRLSKFTDIYELNNTSANRPKDLIPGFNLIRLPEMYYICAECLLQSNNDEARSYLNTVLENRGAEPLTAALTQSDINTERLREYFGEGMMFLEYKRQWLPIRSCDGTKTFQPQDIYKPIIIDEEINNRY